MPAKSILLPVMSAVMPKALKPTLISGNAQPHAIAAVRANTTTHMGRWNMDVFVISLAKKSNPCGLLFYFAEREGFEPPVPLSTAVFKTAVIDHSTISPVLELLQSGCKGTGIFLILQIFRILFCLIDVK